MCPAATATRMSTSTCRTPVRAAVAGALVFSGVGPGRIGREALLPHQTTRTSARVSASPTSCRHEDGDPRRLVHLLPGPVERRLRLPRRASRVRTICSQRRLSTQALNWDNGIPLQAGYRPPPIIDPTFVNYQSVQYQGPTAGQPGRIYNWSFNMQHEVKNFLIDVAYQGNRGTRLNSTIDLNQLAHQLAEPRVAAGRASIRRPQQQPASALRSPTSPAPSAWRSHCVRSRSTSRSAACSPVTARAGTTRCRPRWNAASAPIS